MSVRSSQALVVEFTTRNFSTGVGVNADSLPTATLVIDGVDNGATVTVANVSTGRYKASVTLPALSVGDVVEVVASATVNSVSDSAVVFRDTCDNDIAATAVVSNGAITTNAGKVSEVVLVDTLTTYTGNTPQTGDNFSRIGANGAGLTALGDARLANLDATVSSRASATVTPSWYTTTVTVGALSAGVITDAAFTVPAETPGRPTGILGMVRRIWEWAVNKRIRDRNTGEVDLYGVDDTTLLESQTQSTAGNIDTQTRGA